MATKVTPTFLLKGLDPNKLLADYQAGVFSRPTSTKSRIIIVNNKAILAPTYGTTNESPVFTLKDRNNSTVVVATTGHTNYEIYTKTGGELPSGGRCTHCKQDFTHTAVGYPIAYKELTILTNEGSTPESAVYRILYVFWVEDTFCSFECALSYVRLIMVRPAEFRDVTLRDSEIMLKLMYRLMHPDAPPLRPSQDFKLLNANGGPLTKEEFNDSKHTFVRTCRLAMIPAKVEYLRHSLSEITSTSTIEIAKEQGRFMVPTT